MAMIDDYQGEQTEVATRLTRRMFPPPIEDELSDLAETVVNAAQLGVPLGQDWLTRCSRWRFMMFLKSISTVRFRYTGRSAMPCRKQ